MQIGGPRSARGILGNWFDKDYDAAGPAGPTCFWKVSDDVLADRPAPGAAGFHLGHNVHATVATDGDEEDEEDDDDDDDAPPPGGAFGHGLTLADLGLLGGQAGGAGLVVPLHEVVNILYQSLNGGGGGNAVLQLEDLDGLLD